MKTKKLGTAAVAVLTALATVTGCSSSDDGAPKNVAWSPVMGDNFTSNPGAWQTDGVPAPAAGVTMVGNPVAAQASANAGLPQGTITASNNATTVYYPKAPAIPGLPVAAPQLTPPPPPMRRPVNTRPWHYTPHQIEVYQQICETGTWNNWRAGIEIQSQTCWTLYGRQLGVRPWYPGQPRPWQHANWPTPWFRPHFHSDVPVMWVYPRRWAAPRPQPVISVSISINLPTNPFAHPNPAFRTELYFPVWAVVPGLPIAVHGQARAVPPWLPLYTSPSVTSQTYIAPPVFPGVILGRVPSDGQARRITAVPGEHVVGNINLDSAVLAPDAAALHGATLYTGSAKDLAEALGSSVNVTAASEGVLDGTVAPVEASSAAAAAKQTSSTTVPEDEQSAKVPGKGAGSEAPVPGSSSADPSRPAGTEPSAAPQSPAQESAAQESGGQQPAGQESAGQESAAPVGTVPAGSPTSDAPEPSAPAPSPTADAPAPVVTEPADTLTPVQRTTSPPVVAPHPTATTTPPVIIPKPVVPKPVVPKPTPTSEVPPPTTALPIPTIIVTTTTTPAPVT